MTSQPLLLRISADEVENILMVFEGISMQRTRIYRQKFPFSFHLELEN